MSREPDLPVLVSLAGAAVDAHVLRVLDRHGLTGLRVRHGYVVQRLLVAPATATDLAADLGVTQQAMSKTVAELVRLGYVRTTVDPADRRRRPVELTEAGRRTVTVARRARAVLSRSLRRRVDPDALAAAGDVVHELLGLLDLDESVTRRAVPAPDGLF